MKKLVGGKMNNRDIMCEFYDKANKSCEKYIYDPVTKDAINLIKDDIKRDLALLFATHGKSKDILAALLQLPLSIIDMFKVDDVDVYVFLEKIPGLMQFNKIIYLFKPMSNGKIITREIGDWIENNGLQ